MGWDAYLSIGRNYLMLRGIRRVRAEAKGITSQEKCGFQRKRTTCISSWIKKRELREKKKRRKETEGECKC